MIEVMQLTSAWDALTSRICDAVLNTWLDGSILRSKRPPVAGSLEIGQKIRMLLNPFKSNPQKKNSDYVADVEKGMKIDWLGISNTPALVDGTTLALKKAEEQVEKWVTRDVLRWLVDIDEKSFLGLFADKRVTGGTLLEFSKCDGEYKKLQKFIEDNNSAPLRLFRLARPHGLHIARGLFASMWGRGGGVRRARLTLARPRQSGPGTRCDATSCACTASQSTSWPCIQRTD